MTDREPARDAVSAGSIDIRRGRVRVRSATDDDRDAINRLFREVHLASDLDVTLERDPDPFALLRLHHGTALPLVLEDESGATIGCASVVLRDGWLHGERVPTGYLCDLRLRPGSRVGSDLGRAYGLVLDQLRREHGTELLTTVIFDGNEIARSALLGKGAKRRKQPRYREMTRFDMAAIQLVRPHRGPSKRVRRAEAGDLDRLVAFLDRRNRSRLLGHDFSGDLLQQRLADWPGFELGSFWLAEDGSGDLVGCVAAWDSTPVKRTRVLGYGGSFVWLKRAMDLGSKLLRFPSLPEPGDCFRFAWLTHLEVDDPEVFRDLVRAVIKDTREQRLHFLAAFVPRGSPLRQGLRGMVVQDTPMTLYAVHGFESHHGERDFHTDRPGFEMALS